MYFKQLISKKITEIEFNFNVLGNDGHGKIVINRFKLNIWNDYVVVSKVWNFAISSITGYQNKMTKPLHS